MCGINSNGFSDKKPNHLIGANGECRAFVRTAPEESPFVLMESRLRKGQSGRP